VPYPAGAPVGWPAAWPGDLPGKHLDFFPQDAIGAATARDGTGAPLTLHFAGLPEPVETDIDGKKKIFRRRGPVGRFFAYHHLSTGDCIVIERLSAHEYRVFPGVPRHGIAESPQERQGETWSTAYTDVTCGRSVRCHARAAMDKHVGLDRPWNGCPYHGSETMGH
jgi:hypothetical protein